MHHKIMKYIPAILLAVCGALAALGVRAALASEPIVVIVNKNNSVDALSAGDIRKIYTNSILVWADGAPITIYDLSVQDNMREDFSEKVLGKEAYRIAEEWAHLKITNQAKNPPLTMKSQMLIVRRVSMEKGAIGYVSRSAVRDNPMIKIVNTIQ